MAHDTRSEASGDAAQALGGALDAIEHALDVLELAGDPDVLTKALAGPVRALDAAARSALEGPR